MLPAIGAALVLTKAGLAIFVTVTTPELSLAPVDRLIKNTKAHIKEHPNDAMGPYTLARIHYLALAKRTSLLRAYEKAALPVLQEAEDHQYGSATNKDLQKHLKEAVANYQKAIQMDSRNALFHLGLASVSQEALSSGVTLGAIPGASGATAPRDGNFTALWLEQAIGEYLRAYELSLKPESVIEVNPPGGLAISITHEAGQRYIAMVNGRRPQNAEEEKTLKAVQEKLFMLENRRAETFVITPILFALDGPATLDDLLDSDQTLQFNLDGTGRPQRYHWVRPRAGILVWDPENTGSIKSGHQLFGSVTFNMFWSDGYRALDALDDNRDGALTGNELAGLAVWFDRNQDGVSQPGEVVSIDRTGIATLSARSTGRVGQSLMNSHGLATDSGRVLPTYDWTTSPVPEKPATRKAPAS
jgi:tetratricopeptide (TPR) repeat protein